MSVNKRSFKSKIIKSKETHHLLQSRTTQGYAWVIVVDCLPFPGMASGMIFLYIMVQLALVELVVVDFVVLVCLLVGFSFLFCQFEPRTTNHLQCFL